MENKEQFEPQSMNHPYPAVYNPQPAYMPQPVYVPPPPMYGQPPLANPNPYMQLQYGYMQNGDFQVPPPVIYSDKMGTF